MVTQVVKASMNMILPVSFDFAKRLSPGTVKIRYHQPWKIKVDQDEEQSESKFHKSLYVLNTITKIQEDNQVQNEKL